MNKIVCNIEPGLGQQHVMFFKDDKLETQEAVPMSELVNFLLHTCYTEGCYNLHFIGNEKFVWGIAQDITANEVTYYNTNKINIEVN